MLNSLLMTLSLEVKQSLAEIERETKQLEVSMRTGFDAQNPHNHYTIQRVNNDCLRLKTKVREISAKIVGIDYPKASATLTTATFYISKYEQVMSQHIPLHGDLLTALAAPKKRDLFRTPYF